VNPNSANQTWSKWTWRVRCGARKPSLEFVRANAARFGRVVFGSASQMRVLRWHGADGFKIEVLSEGHPVQDESFKTKMFLTWELKFFIPGFGNDVRVRAEAKLMAGERPGAMDDQMIVLPAVKLI
jgi:hypothetical protein